MTVRSSNGRLQLVFRWKGKREFISTGLADELRSRNLAEIKAKTLENDLLTGNLDETYNKYRFIPHDDSKAEKKAQTELSDIWSQYVDYKAPQVSINTMRKDYRRVEVQLKDSPYKKVGDVIAIRNHLTRTCTPDVARRILVQISAAIDWAIESKVITGDNPFKGLAADIKRPKSDRSTKTTRQFTATELALISEGFKSTAPEYLNLVEFLLMTGCRPGEAIALQWRHISRDFKQIHFEQTIIESDGGLEVKSGLKTQKRRDFPTSNRLQAMMRSLYDDALEAFLKIEADSNKFPDEFVFRSLRGKHIDFHNFSNRIWRKVLKNASIPHRGAYHLRHTFITYCLDNGIDAKDVAAWVGNTPRVIYEYYAGRSKDLTAPDIGLIAEPIGHD